MNSNQRDYRTGSLPDRFPLATALTPMQDSVDPAYESNDALSRGTLFPGLDLPFMNVVNPDLPATPMTEMMAIDFVADELSLYLDTHRDDKEAFAMYQSVLALSKQAHARYAENCAPIVKNDMLGMKSYAWLNEPWPWDLKRAEEG